MSDEAHENSIGDQPGNGVSEADIDFRLSDLYANVKHSQTWTPEVIGALMRDAYIRGREDAKKQGEAQTESDPQ